MILIETEVKWRPLVVNKGYVLWREAAFPDPFKHFHLPAILTLNTIKHTEYGLFNFCLNNDFQRKHGHFHSFDSLILILLITKSLFTLAQLLQILRSSTWVFSAVIICQAAARISLLLRLVFVPSPGLSSPPQTRRICSRWTISPCGTAEQLRTQLGSFCTTCPDRTLEVKGTHLPSKNTKAPDTLKLFFFFQFYMKHLFRNSLNTDLHQSSLTCCSYLSFFFFLLAVMRFSRVTKLTIILLFIASY